MLRALMISVMAASIVSGAAVAQESARDLVDQVLQRHPQAVRDAKDLRQALHDLTITGQADGVGLNGIDLGSLVDTTAMDVDGTAERSRIPAVLVFVSSSMPPASIKAAAQQAKQAGGAVVMRGLVENSLTKTAAFIASVFGDQAKELGVLVDPRLFATYGVRAVPTVVVSAEGAIMCEGEPGCDPLPAFDQIAGDMTLRFALQTVADAGGPGAMTAAAALVRMASHE